MSARLDTVAVEVVNAAKIYGSDRSRGVVALDDVSLHVRDNEFFTLLGPSGCGKTTLLRLIAGFEQLSQGEILLFGEHLEGLPPHKRPVNTVFQHYALFPHMTVAENVAYPLRVQGIGRNQRMAKAQEVIDLVGLGGREENFPRELSGGQRQRVGIARSLVTDCKVWFLDEPFSALDPLIRRQLQDEFLQIQAKLKTTIVFITHDINEALKLADRIAIMRDGRIVQIGTPADIVLRPADDYVREFSKDVAKGQHAHVRSVMQSGPDAPAAGPDDPGLKTGMTLDAALARCMSLYEPVPVHDDSGAIVGTVHPADLAAALQVDET